MSHGQLTVLVAGRRVGERRCCCQSRNIIHSRKPQKLVPFPVPDLNKKWRKMVRTPDGDGGDREN